MVSTPSPPRSHRPPAEATELAGCTVGAPCWASLATPDPRAAEDFYGAVLGWEFRRTSLGEDFRMALSAGVPTASLGCTTPALQVALDWTPYFCVTDADEAAARIVERTGTIAVGPVRLPLGRGVLAADREGNRFGIWEGQLIADWESWRAHRPWRLELRTGHMFEAAIFYGEVLEWACSRHGCCEVRYEHGGVALRDVGNVAARIVPAGTALSGERTSPRWNVYFPVPNADAAAEAASQYGGGTIGRCVAGDHRTALLHDPHGAVFGVESPSGSVIISAAFGLRPGADSDGSPRAGRSGEAA
ncbi:VOC family protein [Streptomyces sp. NBC_00378]|uniref:VOC family protein n=1 Tax=unclassified Streptomyces TaxID=2593676 RepID=UPI0022583324|nr:MULTISPECIES: VOC family protein [unclassified Streptomyces]MCX5113493.1 VOC family protein [Streptomyces sp. NBC_00378]